MRPPKGAYEVYKVVRKHQGRFLSALIHADQRLEGHPKESLQLEYAVGKTTVAPGFTAGVCVFESLEHAQRFVSRQDINGLCSNGGRPVILVGWAELFEGDAEDVRRRLIGYAGGPWREFHRTIEPAGMSRTGLAPGTLLAESFTPTKALPKEDLPVPYYPVEA